MNSWESSYINAPKEYDYINIPKAIKIKAINAIAQDLWNASEKLLQSEHLIAPPELRKYNYTATDMDSINSYNQYISLLYKKNGNDNPNLIKMAQLLKGEVDFLLSQSIYYRCISKAKSAAAHLLAR